jgi:hypothetical protein
MSLKIIIDGPQSPTGYKITKYDETRKVTYQTMFFPRNQCVLKMDPIVAPPDPTLASSGWGVTAKATNVFIMQGGSAVYFFDVSTVQGWGTTYHTAEDVLEKMASYLYS